MGPLSFGDMAQSYQLLQRSTALKTDLQRLTNEISTGKTADLGAALRGDFAGLSSVERGLELTRVYQTATDEAALHTAAMQSALEAVQTQLDETGPNLLTALGAGSLATLDAVVADAGDRFDMIVSMLNTEMAGRSLFSGDRPDQPALISGAEIRAALEPLVAGAATAQDMIDAVGAWFFDPSGGYETLAYQGGTGAASGHMVAAGEEITINVSALDPDIREVLYSFALAALTADNLGPAGEAERRALIEEAGTRMLSANDRVTDIRATIGTAEGRIEAARIRNLATETALELEQSRLISADPYETAAELEAMQMQLESLYILTSRLARLTLAEYLR